MILTHPKQRPESNEKHVAAALKILKYGSLAAVLAAAKKH
jgi:hypothetical protein